MNHAKTLLGMMFAGLVLAGCSGTMSASPEDFDKALSDAKMSIAGASKAGYEWRDSGKILKQAEEAAKAGDLDKAISLANKAKRQGDLAVLQAQQQAKVNGPH